MAKKPLSRSSKHHAAYREPLAGEKVAAVQVAEWVCEAPG